MTMLPTYEDVARVLRYDAASGMLAWRTARGRQSAGAPAGGGGPGGYRVVRVFGVRYLAHRVAWLLHHKEWPAGELDHRNGKRADNRMANLRDVPRPLNQQNQRKAQRTSILRALGVSRSDSRQGFRARIFFNGKEHHLGTFANPKAAHEAYLAAKRAHHPGGTL